jgi:hypothetical protein
MWSGLRGLKLGEGILAAIKTDTLSLTAWQIGMYGFRALAYFYLLARCSGEAANGHGRILVHDADCHDLRLPDR